MSRANNIPKYRMVRNRQCYKTHTVPCHTFTLNTLRCFFFSHLDHKIFIINVQICTALCCFVLHCTAMHCNVLLCSAMFRYVLHCTALYCTALYFYALYCIKTHPALPVVACSIFLSVFSRRSRTWGQERLTLIFVPCCVCFKSLSLY